MMSELYLPEDEAARYVLGELTAAERHEFEARLTQSAELRALVRELEDGVVAISLASPRRRPPQQIWTRIERAVTGGQKRKLVFAAFWAGRWRHGWAAAAICLVGWLLYAFSVNRATTTVTLAPPATAESNAPRVATQDTPTPVKTENVPRPVSAETRAALRLLQASTQEIGVLRWQISELTNQVAQLSHELTRQHALLSEPDRIKFTQLMPVSRDPTAQTSAPISTNLQRALLLAMARELGWLSPTSATPINVTGNTQPSPSHPSNSSTNALGVDFVDLRSGSNSVADAVSPPASQPAVPEPPQLESAPGNALPGFISGTNLFVAIDSSFAPTGTSLRFATHSLGQLVAFGSTVLGSNPMVVTIPASSSGGGFSYLTVSAITPGGMTTAIGQWQVPTSTAP